MESFPVLKNYGPFKKKFHEVFKFYGLYFYHNGNSTDIGYIHTLSV